MTLNEKINKYEALQSQVNSLKEELDSLKVEILSEMDSIGQSSIKTDEGVSAKIVDKVNFKYTDDLAILKYLEENHFNNLYKSAIDTSALNAELKKKSMLAEDLKNYYTTNNIKSLTVKSLVE